MALVDLSVDRRQLPRHAHGVEAAVQLQFIINIRFNTFAAPHVQNLATQHLLPLFIMLFARYHRNARAPDLGLAPVSRLADERN